MRVEQALQLLPTHEALWPLRSLLLTSAHATERDEWSGASPYLTIGKHEVPVAALRRRLAPAIREITRHLDEIFAAYVDALECAERDDRAQAVRKLLEAGQIENEVGRVVEAGAWFAVALEIAEELQDRRPEVEALLALAGLNKFLGLYDDSSRQYERALALSRAEFNPSGAIAACIGLGGVEVELGQWLGAQAWYQRALRLAETAGDATTVARIHHATGEFLRRRGDFAAAEPELRLARDAFEEAGETRELARVLCTLGLLDADLGMSSRAASAFREALAWLRNGKEHVELEVFVRYHFAKLHVEEGRFLEAEDEIRRAEEFAISANLLRRLAQLYSLLGSMRGLQGDETGFVFFEQAIALARMLDRSLLLEAQVYRDYGVFMVRLDRREEARAYLTRAREIFESLGASGDLELVDADLARISA
ncbi:MAG: tetratricopeptide repeat protein [Gemmatimonadaceae bacterium]